MQMMIESSFGNTRGPVFTESLLRTIHLANRDRTPISLNVRSTSSGVGLAVDCPSSLRTLLLQELQDAYPGTVVRPIKDRSEIPTNRLDVVKTCDVLPITTFDAFTDETDKRQLADPVGGILSAFRTTSGGRIECSMSLAIRPASPRRIRAAERLLKRLNRGFQSRPLRQAFIRCVRSDSFAVRLFAWLIAAVARSQPAPKAFELPEESLFECELTLTAHAEPTAVETASKRLMEIAGTLGRFNNANVQLIPFRKKPRRRFLLSAKEVASIWHPLTASGDAVARQSRNEFREVEPPMVLTSRKGNASDTLLGRVKFRQQRNQFAITTDDLRRHMIAIGKTGCGKSTFLLNMVRQQIEAGRGVVLLDPHGQLAEEVLDVIPRRRTNDVIYFDASDRISPVMFNPLVGPPGADATLIADGVLTSFKNVFGFDEGSAPRLLHIFRNSLLTLVGTPDASIAGVQQLLVDANLRKSMVARVTNNAVREFWLTEFNRWNERDRTQYIASLQNKLGAFTTNEQLQKILAPGQQGIQLRHVMDRSQILICNLSKGTVGHDASKLLGSLLLSSLQVAAMSRADIAERDRTDCVIVIDEFHSYLAEGNTTMADALAESRKYRTSYVLSTQMLDGQLDSATLAGVLGNCGSALCMTVGPKDAELLTELLGGDLSPQDLMRIPMYHAYMRMLINGAPSTFSMTTLPPPKRTERRATVIKRVSRQRYGM